MLTAAPIEPGQADRTAARALDEADHLHHPRLLRELAGDLGQALGDRALGREQQPIGGAQFLDLVARHAAPLQADDVQAGEMGPVADHRAVGDDVGSTPAMPPIIAWRPMRTNWWTADRPPR